MRVEEDHVGFTVAHTCHDKWQADLLRVLEALVGRHPDGIFLLFLQISARNSLQGRLHRLVFLDGHLGPLILLFISLQ